MKENHLCNYSFKLSQKIKHVKEKVFSSFQRMIGKPESLYILMFSVLALSVEIRP